MQQYVYGNIGHKGYTYLSSDPGFFLEPKRISAMHPVMYYNNLSFHGNLLATEHQSFWMVTSDLGIPGEPEHLFLQASGVDPYRDGLYVHGYYMEDRGEPYLYGPELLELLKAGFMNFNQINALCQNGVLPTLNQLPMLEIQPLELDEETLKAILYEILQGHRVMLQLPCEGRAAMEKSRKLLLTIYQHLPYAQRRSTGFFTGATAVDTLKVDMPEGIKLFLLDGDADVSNLGSTPSQVFWHLNRIPEAKVPQPYERFLNFLTENDQTELDRFFQYCKKLADAGGGIPLKLPQYAFFLDCYQCGGKEATDGEIRNWAANLYGGQLGKIKEGLYQQIASILPVERLTKYLGSYATSLENLRTFGVPDQTEKVKVAGSLGRQNDIQDIHAALTLEMAESLLAYYPETSKEDLQKGLTGQFLTAIKEEYPCLAEAKPTAVTMEKLEEIPIPQAAEPGQKIASFVKYSVSNELKKLREAVKNTYTVQKQEQKEKGEPLISQWPIFCGTPDLQLLYIKLEEECYLSGEFLAGNEPEGWNKKIVGQMLEVFSHLTLKSREDYQGALDWLGLDLDIYRGKGGLLTSQEEQALCGIQTHWQQILALWETNCTSLKDLLALFAKMDGMDMVPELVEERKTAFATELVKTGPAIEELAEESEKLCDRVRNHPAEKERLQAVVTACSGLKVISEKSNFQQALKQGKLVLQLSEEALCDSLVEFRPDGTRQPAKDLLNRLNALEEYASDPEQPLDASHPGMIRWLIQNLSSNCALMLELARQDPSLGKAVLVPIVTSPEPVSTDTIRKLYYAGWSRQMLLNGAGDQTSEAWNQAAASLFPFHFWRPRSGQDPCHDNAVPVKPEISPPGERYKRKRKDKKDDGF